MRLCVNTGCRLHLIHPLGFDLSDARLRRAGLDYREYAPVRNHDSFEDFLEAVASHRILAFSEHGERIHTEQSYGEGDVLLFGPESVGLPAAVLRHVAVTATVRIPIATGGRSLNLANAAAIAVYEAWRQHGFADPS